MSLTDRLKTLIQTTGPLTISAWMSQCLHDPQYGYYATRPGLGRDFITAPETSQIFGELLGLWARHEWQVMGSPEPFALAELGPGRGTLMADTLRAARGDSAFLNALSLELVEASAPLRQMQAERLSDHAPVWKDQIGDLGDGPLILLANEFLDCLPARQFRAEGDKWREVMVTVGADDKFAFALSEDAAPTLALPNAQEGRMVDIQPGLEAVVDALAFRASKHPTRALFLDYGPAEETPGNTLRAYLNGTQDDPLAEPGRADLTVDVDFGRLKQLALMAGLGVAGPMPQGAFLLALGAQERLEQLIAQNPDEAESLFAGADKLISEEHMGQRFQVTCLSSKGLPPPAGFGFNSGPAPVP